MVIPFSTQQSVGDHLLLVLSPDSQRAERILTSLLCLCLGCLLNSRCLTVLAYDLMTISPG